MDTQLHIDDAKGSTIAPSEDPRSPAARLARARKMIQHLRRANRRLVAELATARQRERERLASALHDEIGGDLTAAIVPLQRITARQDCPSPSAIESAIMALSRAIQHTRALTSDLFPAGAPAPTLRRLLTTLVDQTRDRFDLDVSLRIDAELPALKPAVRDAAFQAVRELVLNIVKHARAQRCLVHVRCAGPTLKIDVTDNGAGFDRSRWGEGIGLTLARQRIDQTGGLLNIISQPGCGTRIGIVLPLEFSREVHHGTFDSSGG